MKISMKMSAILKKFHSYLPQMANSQVDDQIFSGDQPTVERAINVIASVANGFTRHQSSDWRLVCSCKASLGSNFRWHLN